MRRTWLAACVGLLSVAAAGVRATPGDDLKIVVVRGEGAFNVIQPRASIPAIVEVRDGNNQPMAGLSVMFSIQDGPATFEGGLNSILVTTDATGRAVAAGLVPTDRGAIRIRATATFKEQTATVTVAQTNFATDADVRRARESGRSSVAIRPDGGVPGVLIGAIAGGAAAGILLAGLEPAAAAPAAATIPVPPPLLTREDPQRNYSGSFSGENIQTHTYSGGSIGGCQFTYAIEGTLSMLVVDAANGTVAGAARIAGTIAPVTVSGSAACINPLTSTGFNWQADVTGSGGNVTFAASRGGATVTGPCGGGVPGTCSSWESQALTFSGAIVNGEVSGVMKYERSLQSVYQSSPDRPGVTTDASGSTTFPVTLR